MPTSEFGFYMYYFYGFVQDRSNSCANAPELPQSCTNLSIFPYLPQHDVGEAHRISLFAHIRAYHRHQQRNNLQCKEKIHQIFLF